MTTISTNRYVGVAGRVEYFSLENYHGGVYVYAGDQRDQVVAGNGGNLIFGGLGSDLLHSGYGNDTIYGDDTFGDDVGGGAGDIRAGGGSDVVFGGAGHQSAAIHGAEIVIDGGTIRTV